MFNEEKTNSNACFEAKTNVTKIKDILCVSFMFLKNLLLFVLQASKALFLTESIPLNLYPLNYT